MRTNHQLFVAAQRLIEAAKRVAGRSGDQIEEIQLYDEFDDRDFEGPIVATGNWNTVTRYDESLRMRVDVDDTPKRLASALERIGVELAWSDCVTTCDNCYKLLNTNATHYGWQPHYTMGDGYLTCDECLDIPAYLEEIEGDPRRAVNNDEIDPSEHDYFRIEEDLQNGWHPGQDADPKKIAKALRARGIERFLFKVDDIGQFDMRFSVWLHEDERETWEAAEGLDEDEIDGPSNSEALKRGLQEASAAMASLSGDGVKYVEIQGDKVTDARVISPEDFVEKGIKR